MIQKELGKGITADIIQRGAFDLHTLRIMSAPFTPCNVTLTATQLEELCCLIDSYCRDLHATKTREQAKKDYKP